MATFTLLQYQAICDAYATGELVVQYDGKRIQYRSLDELARAKALIQGELIAAGLLQAPSVAGVERGSTTYGAYCPD